MVDNFGKIHIICGDGKGKTTAAVGLSIRAAGRGRKVLFTQFLKSDNSGELAILNKIDMITVMPIERFFGFTWQMTQEQKEKAAGYYNLLLNSSFDKAKKEKYDLLILDEIISVYNYDFIDHTEFLNNLRNKPQNLEIMMTGRNPQSELIDFADYISEIKKVKHPYDQGLAAREGIEY